MKKVIWYVHLEGAGNVENEFWVDKNMPTEEIEERAKKEVFNLIDWGYIVSDHSERAAKR